MISVIIPLYNKEKAIELSLRSVVSQSFTDFEIIIVDDGSTDASLQIVEQFFLSNNFECKYRILRQENGGPSKARNTGINAAIGDWIVTLDADDELVENAFLMMMEEVKSHPDADIIDFGGYVRCNKQLIPRFHPLKGWVKNPYRALYFRQISPSCGHAIIRSEISKSNPYDERIRRFEDYELELRAIKNAKIYSSQYITEIHNVEFAEASGARRNISEDFLGHLCFKDNFFWHKMCLYRLFVEERDNYPGICKKMYPSLYRRYDLMLMHKVLLGLEKIFR